MRRASRLSAKDGGKARTDGKIKAKAKTAADPKSKSEQPEVIGRAARPTGPANPHKVLFGVAPGPPPESIQPESVAAQMQHEAEDEHHEQLQKIKARTMFEITEDIIDRSTGEQKKLLFLTNLQAELIASSDVSLGKMLEVFEIDKPKLVIDLQISHGSEEVETGKRYADGSNPKHAGQVARRPPYLTPEDEYRAINKLDVFMSESLLPLAAQHNALVFCTATTSCMLAGSLIRMINLHRAKWGTDIPFSVLSCCAEMEGLYTNPDEDASWRKLRHSSKQWQARDKKICELIDFESLEPDSQSGTDLDANALNYLIVDTINTRESKIGDKRPFTLLVNELLRYLATTVPCLSIKTGGSAMDGLSDTGCFLASLDRPMDAMLSGSSLLFLDLRERPKFQVMNRKECIESAIEYYSNLCQGFLDKGLAESQLAMTIAFFREVLVGNQIDGKDTATQKVVVPLHEAIVRLKDKKGHTSIWGDAIPQFHKDEIHDADIQRVSSFIANKYFDDSWAILPESITKGRDKGSFYGDRVRALDLQIRTFVTHRNFHTFNPTSGEEAGVFAVSHLVKVDRLPKETNMQGLVLLRSAWCEHDVASYLSNWYKMIAKLIFALQLFVAWCIVTGATLREAEGAGLSNSSNQGMDLVLFGLATLGSVITAVESFLSPQARWRQLRSGTNELESMIWLYRARVDAFAQDLTPEKAFLEALRTWREELISGAALEQTDLERIRSPRVYKHFQFEGDLAKKMVESVGPRTRLRRSNSSLLSETESSELVDDFHSPVTPADYIEIRLNRMMLFYQKRLPTYIRHGIWLKALSILCSTAGICLVYFGLTPIVVVVTALSSTVVSWSEYSSTTQKIERYTRAVRGFKNLRSWWDTLSEIEQQGTGNICYLIMTCEDVVGDERRSWRSTAYSLGGGPRNTQDDGTQQQSPQQQQQQQKQQQGEVSKASTNEKLRRGLTKTNSGL